jgi:NAD(P)-dependent dehydrogenase (short-subunit alcohol dehydrogenase family)
MKPAGSRVVVTGASRGIGAELASRLTELLLSGVRAQDEPEGTR